MLVPCALTGCQPMICQALKPTLSRPLRRASHPRSFTCAFRLQRAEAAQFEVQLIPSISEIPAADWCAHALPRDSRPFSATFLTTGGEGRDLRQPAGTRPTCGCAPASRQTTPSARAHGRPPSLLPPPISNSAAPSRPSPAVSVHPTAPPRLSACPHVRLSACPPGRRDACAVHSASLDPAGGGTSPFVSHAFLSAMEESGSVCRYPTHPTHHPSPTHAYPPCYPGAPIAVT